MFNTVKSMADTPVWKGGKTLHWGELGVWLVSLVCLFWAAKVPLKSFWVWVALLALLFAMIIWWVTPMEVTLGGLTQLLVTLLVLLGSIYLCGERLLTPQETMTLWGGLLAGMGIGYANGKKTKTNNTKTWGQCSFQPLFLYSTNVQPKPWEQNNRTGLADHPTWTIV